MLESLEDYMKRIELGNTRKMGQKTLFPIFFFFPKKTGSVGRPETKHVMTVIGWPKMDSAASSLVSPNDHP